MIRKKVIIDDENGLHLRPAGRLVSVANKCSSHVMMINGEHTMNCKSLMSLLAFPVCPGDEVTIECYGDDEEQAMEKVLLFFENMKNKT